MSFTTYSFILVLLPIMLVCYYLIGRKESFQNVVLLTGSIVFIFLNSVHSLIVCLLSSLFNYWVCVILRSPPPDRLKNDLHPKGFWFVFLVVLNIGTLVCYKYFVLGKYYPLGLSFYTFSQLLFLKNIFVDGKSIPDFRSYLTWILFMGKFSQGPICTYDEIEEFGVKKHHIDWNVFADGIVLFVFGMAKKLLLADNLAIIVDNAYSATDLGLVPAWIGTLSYTFQLYFDFSGYSDMAMGVGLLFGIRLPQNFNSPYKSSSVSEFWRRWHITLGRALTQLVYFPLGGSRCSKARTCLNLMIVMLISGIWHGNTYTFVIWGFLNGFIMIVERLTGLNKKFSRIQKIITFFIINFLWIFFRSPNIGSAIRMIKSMFNFGNIDLTGFGTLAMDGIIGFPMLIWDAYIILLLFISFIVCFAVKKNSYEVFSKIKTLKSSILFIPLLFVMSFACLTRAGVFLYQNF